MSNFYCRLNIGVVLDIKNNNNLFKNISIFKHNKNIIKISYFNNIIL